MLLSCTKRATKHKTMKMPNRRMRLSISTEARRRLQLGQQVGAMPDGLRYTGWDQVRGESMKVGIAEGL